MTDLSEFHDQLREVARDALRPASPSADPGRAPAPIDWTLLASSGWLGMEVPEGLGGAGATFAEVAVVLSEMGRAATCGGYLGPAVLGIGALNLLEGGDARDDLLRRAAAGDSRLTVALGADDVDDSPATFDLRPAGTGLEIHGQASFVPDASEADQILVLARRGSVPVVVAIPPGTPGLSVSETEVTDPTRRVATVRCDGIAVDPEAVWPFAGDADAGVWALFHRAAVALACDSLGVAEAMMAATVDYARVREQFGRPIGSFQAVKHASADMLVQVTVGRELVAEATEACVNEGEDSWVAAARAKSYATQAAVDVTGRAMQLHGGIGYTWESGIHFYMKRALFNRAWFGSPGWHRRRLATRYL